MWYFLYIFLLHDRHVKYHEKFHQVDRSAITDHVCNENHVIDW